MNLTPVDPFDPNRLYHEEKYNLQNMLIKQTKMPHEVKSSDKINEIWFDRINSEVYSRARGKIKESNNSGDAFFNGVNDEEFLAFCQVLADEYGPKDVKITGAMLVRYTNASSGYPCNRLTMISVQDDRKVYSGNGGPNVTRPKYDWDDDDDDAFFREMNRVYRRTF